MKLLIIRHADPDYSIDSLTQKGWREAEYLSQKLAKLNIKAFYVSPRGRAKDTAFCTLKKLGRTAVEKTWLREFQVQISRPDRPDRGSIPWDWLPKDWTIEEKYYCHNQWMDTKVMQEGKVKEAYEWVTSSLDELLKDHGYVREGKYYKVEQANEDTLVLFCHFGVECVMLSHLLNVSPMVLWHGMCAAPSSVTTVVTEERRKGIACMRMSSFGDISHLYAYGEPPAFTARYCECYDNKEQRHD